MKANKMFIKILNPPCLFIKNNAGSVLLTMLIIVGVTLIVFSSTLTLILNTFNNSVTISQDTKLSALKNELDIAFQSRNNCDGALQTDLGAKPIFNPTNPTDIITIALGKIYAASQPIITIQSDAAASQSFYNGVLEVEQIELKNNGMAPTEGNITLSNNANILTQKYFAELNIKGKFLRGIKQGKPFSVKFPLSIFVNKATKEIETCESDVGKRFLKTLASRNGVTVNGKTCTDTITGGQASPLITGLGIFCNDVNNDNFCDPVPPDPPTYTTISSPHPLTTLNLNQVLAADDVGVIFFTINFPERNILLSGPPPISTGPGEGRCLVNVARNDSNESNNDIYRLCNAHADTSSEKCNTFIDIFDGIGCNNTNGWYMTRCEGVTRGLSDVGQATILTKSIDGNTYQFCIGAGFQYPHGSMRPEGFLPLKPWLNISYSLEITCEKALE